MPVAADGRAGIPTRVSPLTEVFDLYDSMTAPRELWVYQDQHHNTNMKGSFATQWAGDHHSMSADWLKARMSGRPIEKSGGTKWLASGSGPNDPEVRTKRTWFEDSGAPPATVRTGAP